MLRRVMALAAAGCMLGQAANAKPFENLVPKFNRMKSNAMVRKIENPTRANLDYAAYYANPVLYEPQKFKPQKPDETVTLESITFEGFLSDIKNTLDGTPLTDEEKGSPLAWTPLNKALWEVAKDQGFQVVTSKINGYKWADPNIYQAYQEIAAAWLHDADGETEVWVRVEFKPWVKFIKKAVTDEDNDGFREIYGKLSLEPVSEEARRKAFKWIRTDYTTKKLNRQEVIDWITALASYWYPTKNTDIIDMGEHEVWPNEDTKNYRKIKRTMKKTTVKDPIAVVEGKPFDPEKPIFNVYVVEGLEEAREETAEAEAIENKRMDSEASENFEENNQRFAAEASEHGGYEKWVAERKAFIDAQKAYIDSLPEGQMGIEGEDEWVFFRKSIEYTAGGDYSEQPPEKNPIPHLKDLKAHLDEHDVNLLYVVVPVKSEVYFDKLPVAGAPSDATAIVNPYSRKILADIQDAGIEVIDLLPAFLEAKTEDADHAEPVYQKQDTHWTNRGLQIAAAKIAERIKRYSWYDDAAADAVEYVVVDTTFSRQGDIVDKLPQERRVEYPAVTLSAQQVYLPDGTLNRGDKNGPIILMGDSFTGVFEKVDCKGAGIGSHMAAKTGLPVDMITSWGGGPLVRRRMMRARGDNLDSKRLIVYLMVARDLYNYAQSWEPLQTSGK
jgi:alginate O-acetyltransferase complex protein AlgJ